MQKHKLWNYSFYLYHLRLQTKKTGLEVVVWNQYISENVGWIPSAAQDFNELDEAVAELKQTT